MVITQGVHKVISFAQPAGDIRKAIRAKGVWCQVSVDLSGDRFATVAVSKKEALRIIANLDALEPVLAAVDTKSNSVTLGRTAY